MRSFLNIAYSVMIIFESVPKASTKISFNPFSRCRAGNHTSNCARLRWCTTPSRSLSWAHLLRYSSDTTKYFSRSSLDSCHRSVTSTLHPCLHFNLESMCRYYCVELIAWLITQLQSFVWEKSSRNRSVVLSCTLLKFRGVFVVRTSLEVWLHGTSLWRNIIEMSQISVLFPSPSTNQTLHVMWRPVLGAFKYCVISALITILSCTVNIPKHKILWSQYRAKASNFQNESAVTHPAAFQQNTASYLQHLLRCFVLLPNALYYCGHSSWLFA